MDYSDKRAIRVDLQRRKQKQDAKLDWRQLQNKDWDDDEDEVNKARQKNQHRDSK